MKLLLVENLIFLITVVHSFPSPHSTHSDASASSQAEGFSGFRRCGRNYPEEMHTHFHGDGFHRGEHEGITGDFPEMGTGWENDFLENGQSGHADASAAASASAIAASNVGLDNKNSMAQAKSETLSNSNTAFSSSLATSISSNH